MPYIQGVWWRPNSTDIDQDLHVLSDIGVTDVCVWAEPFIDRLSEWRQMLHEVQGVGIRFHTWITVNHHYAQSFIKRLREHPDWVAVDYFGNRSTDAPLAGVQTWPCPANEDRWLAEWEIWAPLVIGADGLHLDYVRYPDGFRFGEKPEMDRMEVAEQSYCYCPRCCEQHRNATGVDPRSIPIDNTHPQFIEWQKWRQDQIVKQVHWYRERLFEAVPHDVALSAAVFPTPKIARNNVQQDWARFSRDLDFVCPMIYAKQFWGQPVSWTKEAVLQGNEEIAEGSKLLTGIGPHESYSPEEVQQAIRAGRDGGADGEMLFVFPMGGHYVDAVRQVWTAQGTC